MPWDLSILKGQLCCLIHCAHVFLILFAGGVETVGEISVMIASSASRRKGLARAAVEWLMEYANETMGLQSYVAKINAGNHQSIALFKKLGFDGSQDPNVFGEIELRKVSPRQT